MIFKRLEPTDRRSDGHAAARLPRHAAAKPANFGHVNLHVDVVSINDAAGSIKNKPSLRDVPLHPQCRELLKLAKSKVPEAMCSTPIEWKHSAPASSVAALNVGSMSVTRLTHSSDSHISDRRRADLNIPGRSALCHRHSPERVSGQVPRAPSRRLRTKCRASIDPLNR